MLSEPARPSPVVSRAISAALVIVWAVLRLAVFHTFVFPLTYALPLLIGIWTRDRLAIWTMAVLFAVLQTLHQFWILPQQALTTPADVATLLATYVNIFVAAAVVDGVIRLRSRLESALSKMTAQSEQLESQSGQLERQNAELTQNWTEISEQAEELAQQNEELQQQNDELQRQSDDIAALNDLLARREGLLDVLLQSNRTLASEREALQEIAAAALQMFSGRATATVIYEIDKEHWLVVRAAAGALADVEGSSARLEGSFVELVLDDNRTASVNDVSLRPDLRVPTLQDGACRSVLCAPVSIQSKPSAAVALCADRAQEWRDEDFRLADWLAAQIGRTLGFVRLQAALQRQAALIDLTPDAIFVRRRDIGITFWSKGAEALYGWTAAEALGRSSQDLLQTMFPEPLDRIEEAMAKDGRWSGELVHTTKDGREVIVASRWSLHPGDTHSEVPFILESDVDITERRAAEDRLREIDRRKDEFLATLSHELRNPLAPMQFALELLARSDGATAVHPRQVIERQLRHLVRLVDDLLDLNRITSNKVQLRLRRTDVGLIAQQVVESCAPSIRQSGHTCDVIVHGGPLWVDADADPDRLAQVFSNLLNNAIRYTTEPGQITVTAGERDGFVEVSVRDTGVGLSQGDLKRVFEMFEQLGNPGEGGLGIGLWLVRRITELHGGSVEARSDGAGRGSEFMVRLPRAPQADAPSPATETPASVTIAPRRVLVVDDNADAAEMLRTLVVLDGHEAAVAHDGRAALKLARTFRPDVALIDIALPGMNGYELARKLRGEGDGQGTYLVAVTGFGTEADRARAQEAGFDAHLTKPADPERIASMIRSAARDLDGSR